MYIVLGKFEKRNQQMQLIINQLFEVEAYDKQNCLIRKKLFYVM